MDPPQHGDRHCDRQAEDRPQVAWLDVHQHVPAHIEGHRRQAPTDRPACRGGLAGPGGGEQQTGDDQPGCEQAEGVGPLERREGLDEVDVEARDEIRDAGRQRRWRWWRCDDDIFRTFPHGHPSLPWCREAEQFTRANLRRRVHVPRAGEACDGCERWPALAEGEHRDPRDRHRRRQQDARGDETERAPGAEAWRGGEPCDDGVDEDEGQRVRLGQIGEAAEEASGERGANRALTKPPQRHREVPGQDRRQQQVRCDGPGQHRQGGQQGRGEREDSAGCHQRRAWLGGGIGLQHLTREGGRAKGERDPERQPEYLRGEHWLEAVTDEGHEDPGEQGRPVGGDDEIPAGVRVVTSNLHVRDAVRVDVIATEPDQGPSGQQIDPDGETNPPSPRHGRHVPARAALAACHR